MVEVSRGGSISLPCTTAGMNRFTNLAHHVAAKHGVAGLVKILANELQVQYIRVDIIHLTDVATGIGQNAPTYKLFAPRIEHPQKEQAEPRFHNFQCVSIVQYDGITDQQTTAAQ